MLTFDIVTLLHFASFPMCEHRIKRIYTVDSITDQQLWATNGIYELIKMHACKDVMIDAIQNGHFNIVKWALLYNGRRFLHEALKYGHIHIAKWLFMQSSVVFTTEMSYFIACNLEALQWFIGRSTVPLTKRHIQLAAKFPEIVKWIYTNGHSKGMLLYIARYCTFDIFLWATQYEELNASLFDCGNMEVVKWLIRQNPFKRANRKELFVQQATLNYTMENGRVDIVGYLYMHMHIRCSLQCINNIIMNKHYDMITFMHANCISIVYNIHFQYAIVCKQYSVLTWIIKNRRDLVTRDYIHLCNAVSAYILHTECPEIFTDEDRKLCNKKFKGIMRF